MRLVWLLLLVAGIPLASFVLISGAATKLDTDRRVQVGRGISTWRLAAQCDAGQATTAIECDIPGQVQMLRQVALATAVVGVGMLGAIGLAGLRARSSRVVLLVAFGVGLPLVNLVLIGLVLAQG